MCTNLQKYFIDIVMGTASIRLCTGCNDGYVTC